MAAYAAAASQASTPVALEPFYEAVARLLVAEHLRREQRPRMEPRFRGARDEGEE